MPSFSRRLSRLGLSHLAGGLLAMVAAVSAPAAAQELTIYGTREAGLTVPILDKFAARTNTPVNYVHFKSVKELQDRLAKEGETSPADIAVIPDIGGLFDLVTARRTHAFASTELDTAIPRHLKHPNNMWVGLSYRIRAIYVSKDRVANPPETYADLADPRFAGKLCIRSGSHPYNSAWFGAMLLKEGDGLTAMYIQGLKRNLARTPAGGDRDVAKDIAAGLCDVGVANTYYMGVMLNGGGGPDQKKWAESVKVVIPTFSDRSGAHVNISGAAVMRHAPNKQGAIRLLEYMASEEGQKAFADLAFEYPVRAGVPIHPILAAFGEPTSDLTTLPGIAMMRPQADRMVASIEFDAPVQPVAGARTSSAR